MIVRVPERGATVVDGDTWTKLSSDHRFWRLVDRNILRVEAHQSSWRLHGTCFVGKAVFGDVVIEVTEKFEGAFSELASLARPRAPKLTATPSPVTTTPSSIAILIELFLAAAKTYLSGFQVAEYQETFHRGATVSGRLDVRNTVRLRSRGIRHQAAFQRSELSIDLPLNRVVFAALSRVEHLSAQATPRSVSEARALRVSLEPCALGAEAMSLAELGSVAALASADPDIAEPAREVAAFAGAILDTAGFGGDGDWTRTVNRSWFVNLEWLFEEAVRQVAKQCVGTDRSVDRGGRVQALFSPDQGRYRANPDLVVRDVHGPVAVGDAKYKELAGWPSASDVHELLAHSTAYGSGTSLLVYPGDSFAATDLGVAGGHHVWCFQVDLKDFAQSIRRAFSMMGMGLDTTSELTV